MCGSLWKFMWLERGRADASKIITKQIAKGWAACVIGCHHLQPQDDVLTQSSYLEAHQARKRMVKTMKRAPINNITKPLFLCLLPFNFASTSAKAEENFNFGSDERANKHYNLLFFQFYSSENRNEGKKIGIFIWDGEKCGNAWMYIRKTRCFAQEPLCTQPNVYMLL